MWHMIICDDDEPEREQLRKLALQCLEESRIEAQIVGCANWQELDNIVKQKPPDVIIVAQGSVAGLNTIGSARMLAGKTIWFSDLDFSLQAYMMCVPYFSKKPISHATMRQALSVLAENYSEGETELNQVYK